jgi:hypothetical protein
MCNSAIRNGGLYAFMHVEGEYDYGLTKREYFASMAMSGLLSAAVPVHTEPHDIARVAVQLADALLQSLES